jgi:hypothetical protein
MGKAKPPNAKRGRDAGPGGGQLRAYFGAGIISLLAIASGSWLHQQRTASPSPHLTRHASAWAERSHRLSARSPSHAEVSDSCEVIAPLFNALGPDALASCDAFLRDYWEAAPLLSRPGAAWTQGLMTLDDIGRMIGSWPVRFFKNHATAAFHTPNSGFLPDTSRREWQRGEMVPTNAVEIAIAEGRTLVMHNLEVYWPPVGALIRHVVRFFHTYTQVNLYMSPPGLQIATAPHQDAHSVFIVQTHGRKRWCVHAPRVPLTLKAKQRGKNGDVISPDDRHVMSAPLINVTLSPGQVLYIPRAFFHHTATGTALIRSEDVVGGGDGGGGGNGGDELDGQPSMALTISVLSEDVFVTWLHVLGEALQELPQDTPVADDDAASLVRALRRAAVAHTVDAEGHVGVRLREALPRALVRQCKTSEAASFTDPANDGWRAYAVSLLMETLRDNASSEALPAALSLLDARAPLFEALDAVLRRKRIPCTHKLEQIEAMADALKEHALPLTGQPVQGVDVDSIFLLEKRDRSYLPADREWFQPNRWS